MAKQEEKATARPYGDIGKEARVLFTEGYDSPFEDTIGALHQSVRNELVKHLNANLKRSSVVASILSKEDKHIATISAKDILPCTTLNYTFSTPENKSETYEIAVKYDSYTVNATHIFGKENCLLSFQKYKIGVKEDLFAACVEGSSNGKAGVFLKFTGSFGAAGAYLGADLCFNWQEKKFTKRDVSCTFPVADVVTAWSCKNMGQTLAASFYGMVNQTTGFGFEVVRDLSTKKNSFTIGISHQYDEVTMLKARLNQKGEGSAVLSHQWYPNSVLKIGVAGDLVGQESSKVGFSIGFKL